MRREMAVGLATAAAFMASGCGEQGGHEQPVTPAEQALHYVAQASENLKPPVLTGLQPDRYKQVATFSLSAGGVEYSGAVLSDRPVWSPNAEKLYATVQGQMIEIATEVTDNYRTVGLPLYSSSTNHQVGKVQASLNVMGQPSVLALTGPGEITTLAHRQKGVQSAETITNHNRGYNKLSEAVSIVTPSGSRLQDTSSVATEACQAKVDVETGSEATRRAAQEVICNSFGVAYGYALNGYSYAQYFQAANTNRQTTMGTYNEAYLRFFILPPAAYGQIQHGQTPTKLQGLKSEAG